MSENKKNTFDHKKYSLTIIVFVLSIVILIVLSKVQIKDFFQDDIIFFKTIGNNSGKDNILNPKSSINDNVLKIKISSREKNELNNLNLFDLLNNEFRTKKKIAPRK